MESDRVATSLRLTSLPTGSALFHPGSDGTHERGVAAAVFYLAGAGMVAVAALDPRAHTAVLLLLAATGVVVAMTALLARRVFTYVASVVCSLLGTVLIAVAVVAGSGSWSSALAAVLYTFVAVYTALVLRWQHATAVLVWAAATAIAASRLVDAPLPPLAVAFVFALGGGTLAWVTLWLVAEVRHRATTDPLTGVANRSSFETALGHAMATVRRTGEALALIAIDLDGFRQVNNAHGHAAGDQLLIEATRAWQPQLRARDQLSRTGGDEFCAVLPGADADQARAVADRLEQVMPQGTACSTGVAVWEDGQPLADLYAAADRDLYASKARNRAVRSSGNTPEPDRRTPA